jgi:hypothetical protein
VARQISGAGHRIGRRTRRVTTKRPRISVLGRPWGNPDLTRLTRRATQISATYGGRLWSAASNASSRAASGRHDGGFANEAVTITAAQLGYLFEKHGQVFWLIISAGWVTHVGNFPGIQACQEAVKWAPSAVSSVAPERRMTWIIFFAVALPFFIFGAIGLGVYAQRLPG